MRIDKFVSYAFNITRKESIDMIKKGLIKVNGNTIFKKDYKINELDDDVFYNDKKIEYRKFIYLVMNKPKGVLSAKTDKNEKTVMDLVEEEFSKDAYPVGRLDKDTTGMLLITNDGSFFKAVTNPKNKLYKTYIASLDKNLSEEEIKILETGVEIKKNKTETFITSKAEIKKVEDKTYKISISEGKFHQVKKMFGYFKAMVLELKRVSIGEISLDQALEEGDYRHLTKEEIKYFLK